MHLTKMQREIMDAIARKGDAGMPESFYSFAGARGRVIAHLRKEGLIERRPDPLPRVLTDRLHLTPAGLAALRR